MRFLCDHMLGSLAKRLRFLGYDTGYPGPIDDNALKALAGKEERVLLTRDKELSGRVAGSVYVESDDLDAQFEQVVRAFSLTAKNAMSLCSVCNVAIEAIPKEAAQGHVPPGVYERHREFWRCRQCARHYWRGSHYDAMMARFRLMNAEPPA